MAAKHRNQPIASWQTGDAVSGFALVTRKERRQDRNGNDYLDMELADASGSITAKVWGDSPALEASFEAFEFVAFRGTVRSFRDRLQLNVDDCRSATEADRQHGFDEAQLVPSTPEDIDDLWRRLQSLYTNLENPALSRLATDALAAHGEALREHPAAKRIHHAYRGGLLEHVVSMAELASLVAGHYAQLDRDLLLVGVLFHDLGKLIELGAMPANDYTPSGRLVGHVVLGRDLLLERCAAIEDFPAELRLKLEHLVLSHQGRFEFGSPVEPMTSEALALHMIDDLDSKLAQLRGAAAAAGAAGEFQYLRGLGRWMLLAPDEAHDEVETDESEPRAGQLEFG